MLQTLRAHAASGDALISGTLLLLLGLALIATRRRPDRLATVGRWISVVGLVLVVCTAAPLPEWLWILWAGAYVGWRFAWRAERKAEAENDGATRDGDDDGDTHPGFRHGRRGRAIAAALLVLVSGVALAVELPHGFASPSAVTGPSADGLVVIGDSISAGLGHVDADQRWPERLARDLDLSVHNLSRGGLSVTYVEHELHHLDEVTCAHPVVVLELGGNDMLGANVSLAEYDRHLDDLLAHLVARWPGRVLMVELPLLPGFNAWGQTQRRLAATHGVPLIPKRVLAGVFGASGATTDGLHLSPTGHQLLARSIRPWVAAFVRERSSD